MFDVSSGVVLFALSRWKNVASDMLVCTNCQAAWAVVFRSELSASATQHLTSLYREQLSSSHMDGCFFRKEAAQYLESNSTKSESTQEKKDSSLDRFQPIVPTLLARVFSSDLMEILEHPNPANQLSSRWRKMLTVISSSTESDGSLHFPNMQVPQSVLDYRPPLDPRSTVDSDAPDTSSSGPTLLTRIVTKFEKAGDGTTETALSGATMESVAALVLLGWIQCQDANESTDNTHTTYVSTTTPTCLSLECPMCLARMELPLTRDSSTGTSESPPPRKRSRQLALDPVQSHRHYCPYVCGFPTAATIDMTPIWQSLALRLLRDDQSSSSTSTASQITTTVQDGADHDDAWIRKMLQSAVSPRSRQPVQLAPLRK
jgi:hypothetical protein